MTTDLTGTTIGNYQIQEQIAQSSTTHVYLAYQPQLKRQVAIKFLQPQLLEASGVAEGFTRAVRSSIALQHRNIERVYEANSQQKHVFKAMEHINGATLRALIDELVSQGKLLPLPVVGNIIAQVATGLTFVHEQEQHPIHGGITASNIMLRMKEDTPDDIRQFVLNLSPSDVVLCDYMASRVLHDAIQKIAPDSVPHLADYMSPEICQGKKGDSRADIYALGIVLYELLTGTVPFAEGKPSIVMQKHIKEEPPSPRTYRPELPAEVEEVVMKAISRNANQRFYDAEAFGMAVKQRMGQLTPDLQLTDMAGGVPGRSATPAAPAPERATPAPSPAPAQQSKQPASPSTSQQPAAQSSPDGSSARKQGNKPAAKQQAGGGGIVLILVVVLVMVATIGAIWWFML
jgi:serine/threonine-protein kinase